MARKNLIEFSPSNSSDETNEKSQRHNRPLADKVSAKRSHSPVGGIAKTLGSISEQMDRANELEQQLLEGQDVVELNPELIEESFVRDRLDPDPQDEEDFIQQIREHGQLVPILVRPHPTEKSRWQVAFGHRRKRACHALSRKVKAVIRDLSDEQLVVLQGQENSARTDLSYIERALFAARLENQKFKRTVISSSLKVDRAAVSKMIKLVRSLPEELIVSIGAAPNIGRRKWMELSEILNPNDLPEFIELLSADNEKVRSSDERFALTFSRAQKKLRKAAPKAAIEHVDQVPVSIRPTKSGTTFIIDGKKAPGFGEFLKAQLNRLYADYKEERGET